MKTIIAGSRTITDLFIVEEAIKASGFVITEVVSGRAKGVDQLGEWWAKDNNVPIKEFPAEWNKHGKAAGPIRNEQMGDYAEALICIWDGESKGSKNMLEIAKEKNIKIYLQLVKKSKK